MQPWERILAEIAERVPPQSYEVWFRPTAQQAVDTTARKISVQVPNQHFRYWLTENYEEIMTETMKELGMEDFQIAFVVADGEERAGEEFGAPSPRETATGLKLNEKYTFESFVVGFSNQFAHAAAMAVAERPSCAYNPLFVYGGVGLGKTHLMHAIGHQILHQQPHLRLCYMSSERFMNELIHSIRYEKQIQFREKYRNIDVLLMDDIQFLAGKERTQEEFFHTFNALYDAQKQIIISSDSPPREIPTLEERLHSRFEWGLIADIQPPDLETKVAILRKKAEAQQLPIDDEVALFIATAARSNIRELEGALIRLAAFHSLTGQEVTVDLARRVLHNLFENQTRVITIGQIQRNVANHYSVRVSDLKAKDNSRRVAEPRQIAMFLSKELTANSLSQIGKEFGGKHHTTVMHAIRKVQRLQKSDAKLRAVLERLTEAIH